MTETSWTGHGARIAAGVDAEFADAVGAARAYAERLAADWPELNADQRFAAAFVGTLNMHPPEPCDGCGVLLVLVYWVNIHTGEHGRRWDEEATWKPHTHARAAR